MPIVTVFGSEKLNWDITRDKYDPVTGKLKEVGNGLKELELGGGMAFDFRTNTPEFREMVWRGQPDSVKMNWHELPVWRVLTNRFKTGFVKSEDEKEYLLTDWGRFMRDYEKDSKGLLISKIFYYEPHMDDIRIDPDRDWHFPMWVIDKLIELGEFKQALIVNKVNLPGTVRLTKNEYERIMEEIEKRREQETGNISGRSKQSTGKAG